MPTVYLETTVPSYLAARPSRDIIIAAHQQITRDWWRDARERFDVYISEAVLAEICLGDPDVVARRLAIVEKLPVVELNNEVQDLISIYAQRLGLTGRAQIDLPHIANGEVIRRLGAINSELHLHMPVIVTPEELLQPPGGEYESRSYR